ncbi:type II toxin-antitoxin system RelE/ParE family toxin (plasmid) [Xylophilus rhododendri]|uniref:Type II toxin-antitoxin system RelE/ParE family toxin n=1 Tax=Xylophilus rhododendri TaxID=2697032 RepID=A0A857JF29_9BURK|nr:type II toxin-antitoxin system RelE/ParE family toxin [Xylophilus rhododendri]QHJ01740.1 type II toxin-antitoxin system RelE/ParE family toxin [Xylophilus rhododendri]
MSYEVVWLEPAIENVLEFAAYVAEDNLRAAFELEEKLFRSTDLLADQPYLFRASPFVPGQREIVVLPNYIVLYEVDDERQLVTVTDVVHARRQR